VVDLCTDGHQLTPHDPVKGVCDDGWLRGDWMQLHSGKRFYPLDPRAEDIDPEDIAHALSLLCRFGGHIDRFYSVAEHCVLMSRAVSPENALAALLHDATEAYVVDVPRPVKRYLPDYQRIEDSVWVAIARRFGLRRELPLEVHQADTRILLNEKMTLMPNAEAKWPGMEDMIPLNVRVWGWDPERAELEYLDRLTELTA
jgi:hypothetical protein